MDLSQPRQTGFGRSTNWKLDDQLVIFFSMILGMIFNMLHKVLLYYTVRGAF